MLAIPKNLRWLLLASLPCLALKCGTPYCDACPGPPCAGQYQGGLSLRPVSQTWLPSPAPDSLRFTNSNGFRAVLGRLLAPAASDSVVLPAFLGAQLDYSEAGLNPTYTPCTAYFRARQVMQHYRGRTINLDLRFTLFKDLGSNSGSSSSPVPITRAVADTLADIVVLAFNEQYYGGFPVARVPYRQPRPTALGGTAVYLDSVQLAGRKFFGVYQFSRTPYTTAVQPQRFYFRPGQGLVGFVYSNNEQWARL